jgi:hypothetical protein
MTHVVPWSINSRRGTQIEALRQLMRKHRLTQKDVAAMCCVNLRTVKFWLASDSAKNKSTMPARQLQLIALQLPSYLGARKAREQATKGSTDV